MKKNIYSREQYLRTKAAQKEPLNIQLTNNYAFRKTFKNSYIAKGFLIALLDLKEEDVVDLEVIDPFEEGESEEEKEGILDIKTKEEYNSKLQFHVVQLKQIESATEEEKQTELYDWARLLAAKDWGEVEETIRGNPYREAVKNEMYKMSQDEKERYLYLREEMAVSDEVSRMRTAKKEGIERGIELTKKVFKLYQKGYSVEQIAKECSMEVSKIQEILS